MTTARKLSLDEPVGAVFQQPGCRLTRHGLVLPNDLDERDWIEIGEQLGQLQQATQWAIGDWWAFGDHHYGDRKATVEADDWDGPTFQACADAAFVARSFKTSRRREVLTFTHHREVAALPKPQADRLLDWCEATIAETGKPRTTRVLREEVQRRAEAARAKADKARNRHLRVSFITPPDRVITLRTSFVRPEPVINRCAPVWSAETEPPAVDDIAIPVEVVFPVELHARAKEVAQSLGMSIADWMIQLVEKALDTGALG